MKRSRKYLFILSAFFIILTLMGCQTKDSDQYAEESSFGDVDYLMNDYVDQLVRDGASTITGSIEITGTENDYTVTIDEKKVVLNDNYDEGYYIADTNVTGSYALGNDVSFVIMKDGKPVTCSAEEFMKDHAGETDTYYTLYLMGDVVEHIIPLDPLAMAESSK